MLLLACFAWTFFVFVAASMLNVSFRRRAIAILLENRDSREELSRKAIVIYERLARYKKTKDKRCVK
jgi:hypothetical protein